MRAGVLRQVPLKMIHASKGCVDKALCESIRRVGIITPLLLREDCEWYQVVLGNARYWAAKELGMEFVPAVVGDLSKAEADLLKVEDSLVQTDFRSKELHEQIAMICHYYEVLKAQKVWMKNCIEGVLPVEGGDQQKESGYDSGKYVEKVFGVSKRSLNRYVRLSKATPKVIQAVEKHMLSVRAAVELSYLTQERQDEIICILERGHTRVSFEVAKRLRAMGTIKVTNQALEEVIQAEERKHRMVRVDEMLRVNGLTNIDSQVLRRVVREALREYKISIQAVSKNAKQNDIYK